MRGGESVCRIHIGGVVSHLSRKLLLSRGHLAFAAPAHHAARLAAAIRLRLVGIGFGRLRLASGRSSVGTDDAHCAQRRRCRLKNVNDIIRRLDRLPCSSIRLLEVFDGEVDDSSTNLHGFVEARQKRRPLLYEHECAKLALVILKQEFSSLELDFCVAARHRNVINTQVTFMPTAELKDCLASTGPNYVDDTRVVFLLRQTL